MDEIAIISDVHGNLPALDAVMSDIKKRGINRIFCLGDIAGKGPSSYAAVEEIRKNCEVIIKGNWEYLISEDSSCETFQWHRSQLSREQINYIKELPLYYEFYMSGRLTRICHAAPFSVFHRVQAVASIEDKLALFGGVDGEECDVVGYGDIHGAYVQNFRGKTIFNVGSVGNPLDITLASYAILEGKYNFRENAAFSVNMVRLPYDIEKAVSEARASDMPEIDLYINELRTGKYRGKKNL